MSNEPPSVELRKYPNRRYYDATHSRHVTLEEIQGLIRDGADVHAIDTASGEDITAKLLTQIILELDSPKLSVFPVPLLHRLIRANEALVRDFVDQYFSKALFSFLDSQRQFEQYLRHVFHLPGASPMITDWTRFMLAPFNRPSPPGGHDDQPSSPAEIVEEPGGRPDSSELESLRRQVGELQAALKEAQTDRSAEPAARSKKKA